MELDFGLFFGDFNLIIYWAHWDERKGRGFGLVLINQIWVERKEKVKGHTHLKLRVDFFKKNMPKSLNAGKVGLVLGLCYFLFADKET